MNQSDYLIPFVGIIYALSATDLLVSAHRLLIERQSVKFHVVPIIWALISFLMIINGWWGFFEINENIKLQNAGQLFLLSLLPLFMFLIASLSLPHKAHDEMNMWGYFDQHKIPFYLCHATYLFVIPLVLGSFVEEVNYGQVFRNISVAIVFIVLIWLRHWLWHFIAGTTYLLSLLQAIFKQAIS
jgi:hypothetical protein